VGRRLDFGVNVTPAFRRLIRQAIQGYLAHNKPPTPQDNHRSVGMSLL